MPFVSQVPLGAVLVSMGDHVVKLRDVSTMKPRSKTPFTRNPNVPEAPRMASKDNGACTIKLLPLLTVSEGPLGVVTTIW